MIEQKPPAPPSRARWFAFVLLTLAAALALVFLQDRLPNLSSIIFALLTLGSALFAVRYVAVTPRRMIEILPPLRDRFRAYSFVVRWGAGLLSVLCFVVAAGRFLVVVRTPALMIDPLRWTVAGLLLLGVALWLNPQPLLSIAQRNPAHPFVLRIRWLPLICGLLALFILAEVNGNLLQIEALQYVHASAQVFLLIAGSLGVAWGLGGGWWRWPRVGRLELFLLSVIVLAGLFLRVIALETSILRFVDEFLTLHEVTLLWDHPSTRILIPFDSHAAFPWVFSYWQTLTTAFLGNTLSAVRLVSSIIGTLTIPALYFLVRALFDRPLAFLAAVLLATFPVHLHFSRIGVIHMGDPFFGTLALAFIARGRKSGRASDFAFGGALLGWTHYFYEGGRLLFPLLAAVWMGSDWLFSKDKRRDWKPIILVATAALLVTLPYYYALWGQHAEFTPRLERTTLKAEDWVHLFSGSTQQIQSRLYQRFAYPFLLYIALPDQGWFYGGYQPLILNFLSPFFLLATTLLLWRMRDSAARLLLPWLLLTSLGSSLLVDNIWSQRYTMVFPALATLLAIGLRYLPDLIWPLPFRPAWRHALVGIVTLIFATGQVTYYFNEHLPIFQQQFQRTKNIEDIYFRLRSIQPGSHVHIIHGEAIWQLNLDTINRFWNLDLTIDFHYPQQITPSYLASLTTTVNRVFFLDPQNEVLLRRIKRYFYLLPPEFSPFDVPVNRQLALYFAPRFTRS